LINLRNELIKEDCERLEKLRKDKDQEI